MLAESRRDIRYQSSQKAVLLTEGGSGSLCVITDFSSGGLCLAVVGAPGPWKRKHIDLEVNHRTFPCTIVDSGQKKLHCQFEQPINESDLRAIQPLAGTGDEATAQVALEPPPAAHALSDSRPEGTSQSGPGHYDLSIIYIEGSMAGREQIDPAIDAIDATVEVLNPYQTPDQREHWKQGFQDAVRLVAKHLAR